MISGLGASYSSIALASRTAAAARKTVDRTAMQMATGQRVSSARDDGAAWARASALRSQQVTIDYRKSEIGWARRQEAESSARYEAMLDSMQLVRDAVTLALTGSDAATRQAAQTMMTSAWAQMQQVGPTSPELVGNAAILPVTGRWSVPVTSPDTGGQPLYLEFDQAQAWEASVRVWPAWVSVLDNMAGATLGELRTVHDYAVALQDLVRTKIASNSATANTLDRTERQLAKMTEVADRAQSGLTDIDLGKVSTQRRNAETRAELANATVRQAISAYGNMASGLLGNVQRTQRSVLA